MSQKVACRNKRLLFWLPTSLVINYSIAKHFNFGFRVSPPQNRGRTSLFVPQAPRTLVTPLIETIGRAIQPLKAASVFNKVSSCQVIRERRCSPSRLRVKTKTTMTTVKLENSRAYINTEITVVKVFQYASR